MARKNKKLEKKYKEIDKKIQEDTTPGEEKKQSIVVVSISEVFRNLSVSFNLAVYTIYLIHLIFSIYKGVGIQLINIALAIMTAVFMLVYLFLRLSRQKRGKQIKRLKRYYKNFKLVSKVVTTATAIYAILTAISSVSPFALITSFLGAIFLALRVVVEIILHFIRIKIIKKKKLMAKKASAMATAPTEEPVTDEVRLSDGEDEQNPKQKRSKRDIKEKLKGEPDDVFIPIDRCLLYDIEDF